MSNHSSPPTSTPDPAATTPAHAFVLLDRSGSMESVRSDVVGGFNSFLAATRAQDGEARLTLVQFDTVDPAEVVLSDVLVGDVPPLTEATFVPRGATPLLDATGLFIARIEERMAERAAAGLPAEDVTVVTITDGEENSSCELKLADVVATVDRLRKAGWTFVFLSADIGAYDEAGRFGYDPGNVQMWAPDAAGAGLAFDSLGRSWNSRRARLAAAAEGKALCETDDFFEGDKPAEADRRRRHGG